MVVDSFQAASARGDTSKCVRDPPALRPPYLLLEFYNTTPGCGPTYRQFTVKQHYNSNYIRGWLKDVARRGRDGALITSETV